MWEQLAYVHEPGAELLLHVFNPDKQVYHLSHTLCTAILLLYITKLNALIASQRIKTQLNEV